MNRKKLKAMRVYCGFTQKQVADYLGISYMSYNSKEKGNQRFYEDEIVKLCEMFKCTLNDLF